MREVQLTRRPAASNIRPGDTVARRRDGKSQVQKGLTLVLTGPTMTLSAFAHVCEGVTRTSCGGDTASTGVKTRGMHAEHH